MADQPENLRWNQYRIPQLTTTAQEYHWNPTRPLTDNKIILEIKPLPKPLPKETTMHTCNPPKSGTEGALHACECGQHWACSGGLWRAVARLKYATLEAELQFQSTGVEATEARTPTTPLTGWGGYLGVGTETPGGTIQRWRYYEHPDNNKSYLMAQTKSDQKYTNNMYAWYGVGAVATVKDSYFNLRKGQPSVVKKNLNGFEASTWYNTTSSKRSDHGYTLIKDAR